MFPVTAYPAVTQDLPGVLEWFDVLGLEPLAGFRLRHEDVVELVPGVVTRFVLD